MDIQTLQQAALFDKCRQFTRAREVQAAGLYPYFKPISESEDTVVVIEGQKRLMLGSNNYLGLTTHPKVCERVKQAIDTYGAGMGGRMWRGLRVFMHFGRVRNAVRNG